MSSTTRFTCTRVINKPDRFGPDSKEYHYKNDKFDTKYDPKGKNTFWGVKQAPTINGREIARYNENESDIEFIASDSEPIEHNLSSDEEELYSSEEEVTDSECETIFGDSELESMFSDIEYESDYEYNSETELEETDELTESNLKRLPSDSDKNISFKRIKY